MAARADGPDRQATAWLDALPPADLPEAPFRLAPHQIVTNPARFLASLRADAESGARDRGGALLADLDALAGIVGGGARP